MLTATQIANSSYVELLALLSESNRPPGGIDTIRRMTVESHLRPGMNVLHAGCNAGFFSRELVRRADVRVTGIDLNSKMVQAAKTRAGLERLDHRLSYYQADMRALPFASESFDVVASAGALAFVHDKRESSIAEWRRVVRPHGILMDCEFFYASTPPEDLLERLSAILGVTVPCYDLKYWQQLFTHRNLEPYYGYVGAEDLSVTDETVESYVSEMVERHAGVLSSDARNLLHERLSQTFLTFNENIRYLNYAILVYVSRPSDFEPALYK